MTRVGLESDETPLKSILLKSMGAQHISSLQSSCSPPVRLTLSSSTLKRIVSSETIGMFPIFPNEALCLPKCPTDQIC